MTLKDRRNGLAGSVRCFLVYSIPGYPGLYSLYQGSYVDEL